MASSWRVLATDEFEGDLDEAVAYYLLASGPDSARRLLDAYDEMRGRLAALPGHGSNVGAGGLRWVRLGTFTAVYEANEGERVVTLLRLFYMTSNWRERILGECPEG